MEHERLIGIDEAARFLGVKKSWVYEQVRHKRVPSFRVGRFRKFRLSALEIWLHERRDGPETDGRLEAEARGQT